MEINERRNLFTYATKELSQDAFLMWLFNNYDDEDVGPVAYTLLREFCGLKGEKICNLETKAQWHKIDIYVWFETNDGKKHALFIEDKVDSMEHFQLEIYNGSINIKDGDKKIYYKTGYLYNEEKKRVKDADWTPYTIKQIFKLFQPYENSDNLIIRQYIEYIKSRYTALTIKEKPEKSETKEDFLKWLGYFTNTIIPKFVDSGVEFTVHKGQYPYVYLKGVCSGKNEIPTIEIRSNECCGKNFAVHILCYEVTATEKIVAFTEQIQKKGYFKRTGKKKQVGLKKINNLDSEKDFIEAIKKSVEEYLKLMEDWDKL